MSIVKNYILVADAMNNIQFLVWREEDWSLNLVSKDYNKTFCRAVSFLSDGVTLGVAVGDDEGNIQLLQFDPK